MKMYQHQIGKWCLVAVLAAIGANLGLQKTIAAQAAPADAEEGVQVLTRGPVTRPSPRPSRSIPSRASWCQAAAGGDRGTAARPETRRRQRRVDPRLLGLGRRAERFPVGQRHLAGAAARPPMGARLLGQGRAGYQWTSGYWADAAVTEVEYLPEPPETRRSRPQHCRALGGPHLGARLLGVAQRPLCLAARLLDAVQPNWVWVPAHYVWAPRGYVFVDGYWDYAVGRRGVLFARCISTRDVYARPGFAYSPQS